MNIYIDIGHPAHAHALRYFTGEMEAQGHNVLVSARDKDVTHCLLRGWNTKFIDRGSGAVSLPGKMIDLAGSLARLLPLVWRFGPDLVVSWSSYHAAIIGRLLGIPVITFEDTENVPALHAVNRLFSTYIATPACFERDLGKKHIRFNGYKELASLHPERFERVKLSAPVEEPYILLRFVSRDAWHDRGHSGIGLKIKHIIAERLSEYGKVYISSEEPLPPGLHRYRSPAGCLEMHTLLSGASLLFGESASMSAEAAMLGVPAIYIDNTGRGYTRELEREHGMVFCFGEDDESVEEALCKAAGLLDPGDLKKRWQARRLAMLEGKADVTAFMVELAGRVLGGAGPFSSGSS